MKLAFTMLLLLVCAVALGACGTQGITLAKTNPNYRGAVLFRDHCSGCHTLSVVGASGSALGIANRVKNQGPNFNIRKENVEQVLYAIRNGGFSGAIMPENIVVGKEAQEVAAFLAQYSGLRKQKVPTVVIAPAETSTTGTSTIAGASAGTGTTGAAGTTEAGGTSAGTSTGAAATPGGGGTKAPRKAKAKTTKKK